MLLLLKKIGLFPPALTSAWRRLSWDVWEWRQDRLVGGPGFQGERGELRGKRDVQWGGADLLATVLLLSPFPFTHFLISACSWGPELLL